MGPKKEKARLFGPRFFLRSISIVADWMGQLCHDSGSYFVRRISSLGEKRVVRGIDKNFPQKTCKAPLKPKSGLEWATRHVS